jgi:hypothetical protein
LYNGQLKPMDQAGAQREAWSGKEVETCPVSLKANSLKHPGAELAGPV